ncbi:MAG: spermidine synthase [Gammaproteobacteria bacterium]
MFQELAFENTPLGEISLRCRHDPVLDKEVFEVKLNDDFLMSSAFIEGEIALAELALRETQRESLNVLVGGLGLGYTAQAALTDKRVQSVTIVEALAPVIDWHKRHLVPLGKTLCEDLRCHFAEADFFDVASQTQGFRRVAEHDIDLLLLDIDHSPCHRLLDNQRDFYESSSLNLVAQQLSDNGIFAMWSNDPPDEAFVNVLSKSFSGATAKQVQFNNPYSGGESSNTIYIANK